MKRSVKIILFVAGVLILLGVALMAVSLRFGVNPDRWEDQFEVVGVTVVQGGETGYSRWESYESSNVYEVETRNIDSLLVYWASGRVEITPWGEDHIQIAEVSDREITEEDALRWRVDDNGNLLIDYSEGKTNLFSDVPSKSLQVLVPEELAANWQTLSVDSASAPVHIRDMKAVKLNVSTASGDAELTELTAEHVSLSTASGEIAFTGAYGSLEASTASGDVTVNSLGSARETEIDTASGDITVSGECGELSLSTASGRITGTGLMVRAVDADSASGKVELEMLTCPRELDVETTSGNVELTLPADSGFRLEFDHASGDLKNSDFPLSKNRGEYVAGDGAAEFSVDTTSGDLTLHSK